MKNEITGMKLRLIVMNFLQFAVWGAYLTSMGTYLFNIGLGARIGLFYAMQGIVSLFMPAVMGIIADRWVPAQKLYGFCHFMAAVFMVAAGWYGYVDGEAVNFSTLFTFYSFSVAFYMPTLALTNSVAYTALDKVKLDPVIAFPPIRIFGTIGFICSMLLTDFLCLLWSDTGHLCAYFARVSCKSWWRTEIAGRCYGIAGVYTVQTEKDGCFLYIFYVVGGFFTDNQRFCQSVSQQFQGSSRVC